ncbi:citryl-CoA lyase [Falsiroseomonas bella]|uniref:citrate synthase (unknown stereospecificity) n=1 Tax=Falsiroseomonas bella TaxID=2184016 RepID=A0A317FI42_9PROT|nr:citryl-CoA lyase [Falsiroseomonas bella]PWS38042.1 citryl-CoA lyase [Falsiroseomonas bella]
MKTHLAGSDAASIRFRGRDLVEELIGKHGFTEVFYLLAVGRMPEPGQTRVLDACLVTLMDHGWTPTSMIARLAYDSAPSQVQVGIAAGLLAVGDVFAGTMDGCARLLAEGIAKEDKAAWCQEVVQAHRAAKKPMPGFGHPFHKPDDPRPPRLFRVAQEAGMKGDYIALLQQLGRTVDAVYGRHLTINATGALAALLLEIGMPLAIMRGVSVVSRSAGLTAHIAEEQQNPTARHIWKLVEEEIPYEDPPA